jgi:carbohydrate-selective porin OprB
VDVAISRSYIAVAILVLLGWAAAAHAEDAVQPLPAPAGTRTLADTPFQLVLPQGHVFGDWAGSRTWLEERGVTPTLTFVMDALGNPTGGFQQRPERRSSGLCVSISSPAS